MNKELEQQADHIAAIREALEDARIVVGNTHLINVALSSLESLEAHSKPIQGEVPTVPLSPEMVERIVQVVLKWVYKSGEIDYNLITSLLPEEKECGETKYVADLRTRLLGIRCSPGG